MKTKQDPALLILNQMAGPITWELAEDLGAEFGCVALLTGHPETLRKTNPHVTLYPAAVYQRGSFARRALTWLHYWMQAFFWLWRWPSETPLLLFSNPPILCWLGWLMQRLRGTRYSVMVHDIYPDVLVRTTDYSEAHVLVRLWRALNRRAYERADVVMTLGEFMAQTLEAQFDPGLTRAGRIEVIYPWVDTDVIRPIPKAENPFAIEHGQVDKLTVMYSGNMGLGHDIETMIEAARQLQDEPQIHFMFIGAGPKWQHVQHVMETERLPNVTLLGWQPEETIPYSLATADIALVSLEDEFQGLAVPSKSIFAMAAGSAVLAITGTQNELYAWIRQHACGEVVLPGASDRLLRYLRMCILEPEQLESSRHQARMLAEHRFSRSEELERLLGLVSR